MQDNLNIISIRAAFAMAGRDCPNKFRNHTGLYPYAMFVREFGHDILRQTRKIKLSQIVEYLHTPAVSRYLTTNVSSLLCPEYGPYCETNVLQALINAYPGFFGTVSLFGVESCLSEIWPDYDHDLYDHRIQWFNKFHLGQLIQTHGDRVLEITCSFECQ